MPPTPSPDVPSSIEVTPQITEVHNKIIALRDELAVALPAGDREINLSDLKAAVTAVPVPRTNIEPLIDDVLSALGGPPANQAALLAMTPPGTVTVTGANRPTALAALNRFLSRSPVAAREAATKHQEVRQKLEKLNKAVVADRPGAFTEFVDALTALRTAHPTSPQWTALEARIRALYSIAPSVTNVIDTVRDRGATGVTPAIAAQLLAVEVGGDYPGGRVEQQINRINGQIDRFVLRMAGEYPEVFQRIEQWTGLNAREAANLITNFIRGFIANKFATMVPSGSPFDGAIGRFHSIGKQLHWDIAVREERARLGPRESSAGPRPAVAPTGLITTGPLADIAGPDVRPVEVSPETRRRWGEHYDLWVEHVRLSQQRRLNIDMGAMPSIQEMSTPESATKYRAQLDARVQEVRKRAGSAPAAPSVLPVTAPDPAETARKSVTDYFAVGGLSQDIESPLGTARTFTFQGKTIKLYKSAATDTPPNTPLLLITDSTGRNQLVTVESVANTAVTALRLVNPAGNQDAGAIKLHINGNTAGVPLSFVLPGLITNLAHTRIVIPPGTTTATGIASRVG